MRLQRFLVSAVLMSSVYAADNNGGRMSDVDFEAAHTPRMPKPGSMDGGLDDAWDPEKFDIDDNPGPKASDALAVSSSSDRQDDRVAMILELLRQAAAADPVRTKKILDAFLAPPTLFGRTPKGALILNLDVAYKQLANVGTLRELTGATWDSKRPLTPKVQNIQALRFPHPGHSRIKGQGRLALFDLTQKQKQNQNQKKCLKDKK